MEATTNSNIDSRNYDAIMAMKNSGPGIYNGYDYSGYTAGYGTQGPGIKYIYTDKNGEEHTFYFSVAVGDIDQNSTIDFGTYGSGIYSDAYYMDKYNYSNLGNGITFRTAISPNILDPYTSNCLDEAVNAFMSDLAEVYGISNDNTSVMGYSSTAARSLQMGVRRAQSGSQNVVINCIEAPFGYYKVSDEERQALIDNNAIVLNLHSTNRSILNDQMSGGQYLTDYNGVHTIDVKLDFRYENGGDPGDTHGVVYRYLIDNGLTDERSGMDWGSLPSTWTDPRDGTTYNVKINATEYYLDENGTYVYRGIEDLGELTHILNSGNGVLQTDFSSLEASLNTLSGFVNASSFKSGMNVSGGFSSDTAVPQDEPGIVSNFLASITSLMSKINGEINSIREAGDNIALMEHELASNAEKLNMEIIGKESD